MRALPLLLLVLLTTLSFAPAGGEAQQSGEIGVYMEERDGFLHIKLEGTSREIGYLHGKYLSPLIERGMAAYAHLTELRFGLSWSEVRAQGVLYWPYVEQEYREEIQGIAEGAAEAGARNPLGNRVDWIDVLSYNAIWDIWWRYSSVKKRLPSLPLSDDLPLHHCSAFVATGSATEDGGFVMGQNLWMPYFLIPAHAVFMDLKPPEGHRILMEVTAGMIWSGTEWYINDAALVVAETTLGVGPYQWGGTPSFIRIRKAVQYSDTIDDFVSIMLQNTNGAYSSDYLIADAKTNEVAILELGSEKWALERTTDGFLGSCNYPWDEEVAREMGAPQGWDHSCYPRYVRWKQLSEEYHGRINCYTGMMFLGDHYDTVKGEINPCSHTLCGHVENSSGYPHGSMDGKVVNRTMALRMETWARYGHSCGQPFLVEEHRREHPEYAFDDLIDMIPQPWTTFGVFERLTVEVRDSSGMPVDGAEVHLHSTLTNLTYRFMTDVGGRGYLPYIQTGEYTLEVKSSEGEYRDKIVVDRPTHLTISLHERHEVESFSKLAVALVILSILFLLALKWRREKI
ncbi:MAG: carboxypeptidase regulatory-like domain-containing protein [Thermoplasmata archaeon]|nr:carboxypeptidase regulatory-like domain-containing protein [Thermoplasmata archaeon]